MTTSKQLKTAFDLWNMRGEGPSQLTSGNWRYRNHVLFYQDQPYQRWVHAGRDMVVPSGKVRLTKQPAYDHGPYPDKSALKDGVSYWYVPEIGVHSRFEFDELTEPEYHKRMAIVFLLEVREVKDIYKATKLDEGSVDKILDNLTHRLRNHYLRWHNWSLTFNLDWSPLSTIYKEEAIDEMTKRVEEWKSPKARELRERKVARKLLNEALGHD